MSNSNQWNAFMNRSIDKMDDTEKDWLELEIKRAASAIIGKHRKESSAFLMGLSMLIEAEARARQAKEDSR